MCLLDCRYSMGTVFIVHRCTVLSYDVVTSVRRWAGVRGKSSFAAAGSRHSCPQSVSLWVRDACGHVIAAAAAVRRLVFLSAAPPPPPPGSRLLTDITCATADQPACHVIATAAAA